MPKKTENTLLFAVIEAGAIGRQAALKPLQELGLVAGDDAILLWLNGNPTTSFSEMQFELGMDTQTLRSTLFRFQNTALITCTPVDEGADISVELTEGGTNLVRALDKHWRTLDKSLRKNLSKKQSKKLKTRLHDIAEAF